MNDKCAALSLDSSSMSGPEIDLHDLQVQLSKADHDGDGIVSRKELEVMLIKAGVSCRRARIYSSDFFALCGRKHQIFKTICRRSNQNSGDETGEQHMEDGIELQEFVEEYLRMAMFKTLIALERNYAGEVCKDELFGALEAYIGPTAAIEQVDHIFQEMDIDLSGNLKVEELRRYYQQLEKDIVQGHAAEAKLNRVLALVDHDDDHLISYPELLALHQSAAGSQHLSKSLMKSIWSMTRNGPVAAKAVRPILTHILLEKGSHRFGRLNRTLRNIKEYKRQSTTLHRSSRTSHQRERSSERSSLPSISSGSKSARTPISSTTTVIPPVDDWHAAHLIHVSEADHSPNPRHSAKTRLSAAERVCISHHSPSQSKKSVGRVKKISTTRTPPHPPAHSPIPSPNSGHSNDQRRPGRPSMDRASILQLAEYTHMEDEKKKAQLNEMIKHPTHSAKCSLAFVLSSIRTNRRFKTHQHLLFEFVLIPFNNRPADMKEYGIHHSSARHRNLKIHHVNNQHRQHRQHSRHLGSYQQLCMVVQKGSHLSSYDLHSKSFVTETNGHLEAEYVMHCLTENTVMTKVNVALNKRQERWILSLTFPRDRYGLGSKIAKNTPFPQITSSTSRDKTWIPTVSSHQAGSILLSNNIITDRTAVQLTRNAPPSQMRKLKIIKRHGY